MGRQLIPEEQRRKRLVFYVTEAEREYLRDCLKSFRTPVDPYMNLKLKQRFWDAKVAQMQEVDTETFSDTAQD